VKRWRETLPEGASYETLDCVDTGFYDNTNIFTVPAGHLFVLGDNRDNSTDSRILSAVGYIPVENVIGRVGMIFFSSTPAATARRLPSVTGGSARWCNSVTFVAALQRQPRNAGRGFRRGCAAH
jgi:hypothetical protein